MVIVEYQAGKEYVYKYESQVLTGLPTFTTSHGGIKIVADVKLDFISQVEGVMQVIAIEYRPSTVLLASSLKLLGSKPSSAQCHSLALMQYFSLYMMTNLSCTISFHILMSELLWRYIYIPVRLVI